MSGKSQTLLRRKHTYIVPLKYSDNEPNVQGTLALDKTVGIKRKNSVLGIK